ncbi:hypothetical protein IJV79_01415, partial [bacterium]|nr:hypothetical protein [bacterium]
RFNIGYLYVKKFYNERVGDFIMNFLKELFIPNKSKDLKIGLCQFKMGAESSNAIKEELSIKSKNVKLSDLMRRHYD